MHVVVAPDKFAGTLTAAEAAAAIAAGWAEARPGDELVLRPMADGGEGTVAVVEAALPAAERRRTDVLDALGRPVEAAWLALPDGRALLEAAQACGLWRVEPGERDPWGATSIGVGQLLLAADAAGHSELVVGLGGTATMDGGAGLSTALAGKRLRARVVAAADVTAPLLGPGGAVALYASQKGASEADLPLLERRLEQVADRLGGSWRDLPGAGAAGGLGLALAASCGATIVPGAALVGDLIGLPEALDGADLVLTGEGALDRQSGTGKVPAYVATLARARGLPVFALAGRIEDGAGAAYDRVSELGLDGLTRAAELLAARASELARTL